MRLPSTTSLPIVLFAANFALGAEQQSAARQAAAAGWNAISIASAAIALAAVLGLAWMVRRFSFRRAGESSNDPRQLLHELCQAHGLSRRAERLLRKAAAALGTPHPGRFFLEPQLLLQAEKCEELRGSRRTLGLLHERLFGEDAA